MKNEYGDDLGAIIRAVRRSKKPAKDKLRALMLLLTKEERLLLVSTLAKKGKEDA